jgi:hypothetical protein
MNFARRGAIAAAVTAALGAGWVSAASTSLSSTVGESGFNGGTLASMPLTANGTFVPDNTPWNYDASDVAQLDAINTISVSLILGSADTDAPGATNFDELTLGLDGIDTGLKLNGVWQVITSPGQPDVRPPLTFTGTPANVDQILAALKSDNQLVGTILDAQPDDDFITLGSTQGAFGNTTLVINGVAGGDDGNGGGGNAVPLPPAAWSGAAMLVGMGTIRAVKKFKRSTR